MEAAISPSQVLDSTADGPEHDQTVPPAVNTDAAIEGASLLQAKVAIVKIPTPCRKRPLPAPLVRPASTAQVACSATALTSAEVPDHPVPAVASTPSAARVPSPPAHSQPSLEMLAWASVTGHGLCPVSFPISLASALESGAPKADDQLPLLEQLCVTLQRTLAGRQFMVPHPVLEGLQLHPATARCLPRLGPPILDLAALPSGSVAHLYTDGSRGRSGSGWAAAVLFATPCGRWHWQGALAAPTLASVFGEVSHTSDEAESAAICAALSSIFITSSICTICSAC